MTGATGFLGKAVVAHMKLIGLPVLPVSRRRIVGNHQVAGYDETPGAETIIHLAEEPDRSKANQFGENYVSRSSKVVRSLCERAVHVVYASSSAVYGDEGNIPFAVRMPVFGVDTYSRSKIVNERIVLEAGGTVIRLSNLYGKGMSSNNVISDIAKQIPGTGELVVRDDGPIRDFLPVTEAARAFALAAIASSHRIHNVGSGIGMSINSVARIALEAFGEGHRNIVASHPSSRSSFNVLDISETQCSIGWFPSSLPQEQLRRYFRNGERVVVQ